MKSQKTKVRFSATVLAAALWLSPLAATAESSQAGQAGADFGFGVLAVFSNVLYMPVKFCYAVLGSVTGSLAYGLTGGNREIADGIWVPSMGGDYVLTSAMMTGDEHVYFSGLRKGAGSGREGASDEPASSGDEEERQGGSSGSRGGSTF